MLAKRVIPVLLYRHGNLVKGVQFDSTRIVGNVYQAAAIHQARGVDELIVLDVAASKEGRGPDIEAMRKLTEGCFMPITIGGGISTVEHVRQLIANGADKVVINTHYTQRFIEEAADKFGSQAIVLSVDIPDFLTHVMTDELVIKPAIKAGIGELMIGNPLRDGTLSGYDLSLVRYAANLSPVPVIATHGCGTYEHMLEAINAGADAVAAGAMFQWTDATPRGAAEYLHKQGVEVRL